ncbi:MAG: TonB family protein [Sphaerochaetaceae bacterium]|nr:TonB family protein [Sphaerochaetaceae bacterium]
MRRLWLWLTILGTCGSYACALAFIEVPWNTSAKTSEQRISIQLLPTAPSISVGAQVEDLPEESASRQPDERTVEPEPTPKQESPREQEPLESKPLQEPEAVQQENPEQEIPRRTENAPERTDQQLQTDSPLPDMRTFQQEFLERLKERVPETPPAASVETRLPEETAFQETAVDMAAMEKTQKPGELAPWPTTIASEPRTTVQKPSVSIEFSEYPDATTQPYTTETADLSERPEPVAYTEPTAFAEPVVHTEQTEMTKQPAVQPREVPHIDWTAVEKDVGETPTEEIPVEKPKETEEPKTMVELPSQASVAPRQEMLAATTIEQLQTTVTQYIDVESTTVAPQFPLEQLRRRIVYPATARRLGKEGVVLLELWISAEGTIDRMTVLEDPGSGMAQAAITAFENLAGTPGSLNGENVAVRMRYPVRFALQ